MSVILRERAASVGTWWRGLTTRERWLVGILGALIGGAVLVFGVIQPLQRARADALADIRTYETLTARVRAAGTLTPGAATQLQAGPPQAAAEAAARNAGITANFTPGAEGLTAQIADAPYQTVVSWIADVERTTTLRVRRVEMLRGGATGRVGATVEFTP